MRFFWFGFSLPLTPNSVALTLKFNNFVKKLKPTHLGSHNQGRAPTFVPLSAYLNLISHYLCLCLNFPAFFLLHPLPLSLPPSLALFLLSFSLSLSLSLAFSHSLWGLHGGKQIASPTNPLILKLHTKPEEAYNCFVHKTHAQSSLIPNLHVSKMDTGAIAEWPRLT